MNSPILTGFSKRLLMPLCLFVFMITMCGSAVAQEQPPKPISVTVSPSQQLSFGIFIQSGNYGTVTVDAHGVRTPGGSIILPFINCIVTPALFEVQAIPGTLISIINGPDAILTGSNGGTMSLHIDNSNPLSPFIATGAITWVTIGGTLTVGSINGANPAGNYNGTFSVTFIQE